MTERSYGPGSNQDPDSFAATAGYRSGVLANVGAGIVGTRARVYYNGFEFPPTLNVQVTIVQEYDDPKRTVKYLTIAATVTCIITTIDVDLTAYNSTDDIMDYIRTRLSQPGQHLEITKQGLGSFIVNDPTITSSAAFQDIDFGPKPQVMEMKPIAGQRAVELTWLVTTRIPACSNVNTRNGIIQSTYSISWDTNFRGITKRNVRGSIEQTQVRTSTTSSFATALRTIAFPQGLFNEMSRVIALFPPIGGYKRNVFHELSNDKKVLTYSISDEEYISNYPLFPMLVEATISHSLSSDISRGFLDWSLSFTGTLTVAKPAGVDINTHELKKEAWVWLGFFIIERLNRIKDKTYRLPVNSGKEEKSGESDEPQKVYHIPQRVNMTDNIYDNSFSFSLLYKLVCPSSLLFAATGFFDPADIPGLKWDIHKNRLTQLNVVHRVGLTTSINEVPQDTIIDLCNGVTAGSTIVEDSMTPRRGIDKLLEVTCPEEKESFIDWKNTFTVETRHSTISSKPSCDTQPQIEKRDDSGGTGLPSDFQIPPPLENPPSSGSATPHDSIIISICEPQYIVTMTGHAVRMGYGIDAPHLVKYGGQKAIKIGEDIVEETTIAVGERVKSGNKSCALTLYRLDWQKSYVLAGAPKNSNIETDGEPEKHI